MRKRQTRRRQRHYGGQAREDPNVKTPNLKTRPQDGRGSQALLGDSNRFANVAVPLSMNLRFEITLALTPALSPRRGCLFVRRGGNRSAVVPKERGSRRPSWLQSRRACRPQSRRWFGYARLCPDMLAYLWEGTTGEAPKSPGPKGNRPAPKRSVWPFGTPYSAFFWGGRGRAEMGKAECGINGKHPTSNIEWKGRCESALFCERQVVMACGYYRRRSQIT